MMNLRGAVVALALLGVAGCGSSNEDSTASTGTGTTGTDSTGTGSTETGGDDTLASFLSGFGVRVPGGVTASSDFETRLNDLSDTILAVLPSDLSGSPDPVTLPGGTATYTGSGMIVGIDAPQSVTYDDFVNDTYALIASQVRADINFGAGTVSTTQNNFIKADGTSVPGLLQMDNAPIVTAGGIASYSGTVTGTVNGTGISTSEDGFFLGPNGEVAFGVWQGVGSGGTYGGDNLVGAYAVD